MRSERGQSTIEYVAVMAMLAALVVGVGMATVAPTYANSVTNGIQKALCIVTGRECRSLDEQPCVVRSRADGETTSANILFVRLEDGRLLLQERLSDGRIRLTVTNKDGIGGEASVGAGAGVAFAGIKVGASIEANASLLGLFGRGKVYIADNAGEAQRLARQIEDGNARDPDATFYEGGLRGTAGASAGVGMSLGTTGGKGGKEDAGDEGATPDDEKGKGEEGGITAAADALPKAEVGLDVALERALGRRVDRATGETTWYVRADQQISVSASASAAKVGSADAKAQARAAGVLTVTTDRDGRPVDVGAVATYSAGAGYEVSNGAKGSVGGRRHEIEVHADPGDPAVVEALRAWRDSPASPRAVAELTRAIYDRGRIDRRAYEVAGDKSGVSGSVAIGAKVGAGYEKSTESARLVEADTRPPGGLWERRLDCVKA